MNKKVLSAILFSALFAGTGTFTSCIDNDEPAGIEELRGAKAELIRAKVAVEQAEAAYKLAQAEVEKANAAIKNAQAENQKALNEYQELLNERQSITNAEAQAELDAKIAKAEMKAKEAQLKHEAEMVALNEALAKAQRNYELTLAQIEIAKATMSEATQVKISTLELAVSAAQGEVEAAQARVANAEDAYYVAGLMVKSGEIDMKRMADAVAVAEADLAAKKDAHARLTNFMAEEKETAEWRAEVAEIEATVDSLNKEIVLLELAEAKAKNSEEYKALQAAVVAAEGTLAEAEEALVLEEELAYTYKFFGTKKDVKGNVAAGETFKNAVVLLAGAEDAPEGTYTTIGAIENEIAKYTEEYKAYLDGVAKADEKGGLTAAKEKSDKAVKVWSEALAAYNTAKTTLKDVDVTVAEKAVKAFKEALTEAGTDAGKIVKAKQRFADAMVAFYNTIPADQVAFNKITLIVQTARPDGSLKSTYVTKTAKEWLSDANDKDVYLDLLIAQWFNHGSVNTPDYEAFYREGTQRKDYKDADDNEYPTAMSAFTTGSFIVKASDVVAKKLAALEDASKDAFGPVKDYIFIDDDNNQVNDYLTYLTVKPSEADVKRAGYDNGGKYNAYLGYTDKENVWVAKNYKAIIEDLEAAIEYWTAAVEEMNEALTAQEEAIDAAEEAIDAAEEAVEEYEEANFTFKADKKVINAQIKTLDKIKTALGKAIASFLELTSYDGTVEFENWLKGEVAIALEAVYAAEETLINAQNTLAMAQDGKSGVWEYMATVEAELADAMAELEAAQDELEEALANLAKGLEILAETNAK